jgi:hypothetical protein
LKTWSQGEYLDLNRGGRKLHNERLHNLYSSDQRKSRMIMWEGHVACMQEKQKGYKVLVGKPE